MMMKDEDRGPDAILAGWARDRKRAEADCSSEMTKQPMTDTTSAAASREADGETLATQWLDGYAAPEHRNDQDYSSDQMIDAFMAGMAYRPTEQAIRSEYEGEPVAYRRRAIDFEGQPLPGWRYIDGDLSNPLNLPREYLYTHPASEQAIRADEREKALDDAAAIALGHKGSAKAKRVAKGRPWSHGDMMDEIAAQECGEDIAADLIAFAILALKTKGQGDAD
jgi:hypothetical protein